MPQEAYHAITGARIRLRELIKETPHLDWLLLSKRPRNANLMFSREVPDNVWIGTSVEDQKTADERIPHLLKIPAKVRFLSCEPLIGFASLQQWLGKTRPQSDCYQCEACNHIANGQMFTHHNIAGDADVACPNCGAGDYSDEPVGDICLGTLDWVICGGESGPNARPMHPEWARGLRDQCQAAGVPFFFKQWGEYHPRLKDGAWPDGLEGSCDGLPGIHIYADGAPLSTDPKTYRNEPYVHMKRVGKKAAGRLLDGRTWDEFPEVARG
jgi:protein gp37/DNA-directed RNA polymerase subunit RPC12/RpoP